MRDIIQRSQRVFRSPLPRPPSPHPLVLVLVSLHIFFSRASPIADAITPAIFDNSMELEGWWPEKPAKPLDDAEVVTISHDEPVQAEAVRN